MEKPKIISFGERGILCNWSNEISHSTHQSVLEYSRYIKKHFTDKIVEVVPAYCSLFIQLNSTLQKQELIEQLETLDIKNYRENNSNFYVYHIPVCYDQIFGLDLELVSINNTLTKEELIMLHTAPTYRIYFHGFLPGFLYLGGLDQRLISPRKEIPRLTIPKGSVAIGGAQTGIYPQESPGGWQIIGRTPLLLFDVNSTPPSLFKPGDYIQFKSISKLEFDKIQNQIVKGNYTIKKEVHHV